MAQLASAPALGAGGPAFESRYPDGKRAAGSSPFSVGITSVSLAGGLIPQTPCVASLRKHRALVPRTRPPPGRLMTALVPSNQCFPGIGCDSWRRRRWLLAQVSRISGAGVILEWGPAPQNRHSRFPMAQVSPLFPHLRQPMATLAPPHGYTCASRWPYLRQGEGVAYRELAVCRKCVLAEVLQGRFNLCIFARTTVK